MHVVHVHLLPRLPFVVGVVLLLLQAETAAVLALLFILALTAAAKAILGGLDTGAKL